MLSLEKEVSEEFDENDFKKIRLEMDKFQKSGTNEVEMEFNINDSYESLRSTLNGDDFTRVKGEKSKCSYCGAHYKKEFKEECKNCGLSIVGKECIGLKLIEQ